MARTLITSSNLSPLVLIITWFLCVISFLSMLARTVSKIIVMRSLKADDFTSFASLVSLIRLLQARQLPTKFQLFNVAQSVAVTVQTSHGLGKHVSKLTASQLITYSKVSHLSIE